MYKLTFDNGDTFYTDSLTYVKKSKNGCFVICDEYSANGIVFMDTPYHVYGLPEIDGIESVSVSYFDSGENLKNNEYSISDVEQMVINQQIIILQLSDSLQSASTLSNYGDDLIFNILLRIVSREKNSEILEKIEFLHNHNAISDKQYNTLIGEDENENFLRF